jgi:hypothetical protein
MVLYIHESIREPFQNLRRHLSQLRLLGEEIKIRIVVNPVFLLPEHRTIVKAAYLFREHLNGVPQAL